MGHESLEKLQRSGRRDGSFSGVPSQKLATAYELATSTRGRRVLRVPCRYVRDGGWLHRLVELLGTKKEDIDVSITGDTLTIKGERKMPTDLKGKEYQRSEMSYGTFSRTILLPGAVDTDKVEGSQENGILEVCLPEVKAAIPAEVEIKTR